MQIKRFGISLGCHYRQENKNSPISRRVFGERPVSVFLYGALIFYKICIFCDQKAGKLVDNFTDPDTGFVRGFTMSVSFDLIIFLVWAVRHDPVILRIDSEYLFEMVDTDGSEFHMNKGG